MVIAHLRAGHRLLLLGFGLAVPGINAATFDALGDLPGGYVESGAYALSGDGRVVGGFSSAREFDPADTGNEAVLWTAQGGLVGIGGLPAQPSTRVYGLSANGSVAAGIARTGGAAGNSRAFRWTADGGMQNLGTLGAFIRSGLRYESSYATAVSGDGAVVVGRTSAANGFEAFRWSAENGMVGLSPGERSQSSAADVSTDGAVIVGTGTGPQGQRAFRWTSADGMVDLPLPNGMTYSRAHAVSGDGRTVVGEMGVGENIDHDAYVWTAENGFRILDRPTADTISVTPHDVSADGSVIIGWYGLPVDGDPSGQSMHAYIWDAVNGGRDLKQALIEEYGLAQLTDWSLSAGQALSADGLTLAGLGAGPNAAGEWEISGWRATIPEPGPLALLLPALLHLARWRRT